MTHQIFTAADKNYSLQVQVLLLSLVKTQTKPTHLRIFGNGWTQKEIERLQTIANNRVTVSLEEVPTSAFSDIRLSNGFPLATAYNVLAPKYLLMSDGKVLYVDADTVVRHDLTSIFDIELKTSVAATLDAHIGWISSPSMWRPWMEEGLSPQTPYLNTGVMLIDVQRWNENQITEKTMEFLSKYELPCVDQDALNLVLKGDFDILPPQFNSMPYHVLSSFRYVDAVTSQSEISQALTDPVIVHFHRSFLGKPWEYGCIHPGALMWQCLAREVQPNWRKKLDLNGLARRRAAKWAKMLRTDSRVIDFPIL